MQHHNKSKGANSFIKLHPAFSNHRALSPCYNILYANIYTHYLLLLGLSLALFHLTKVSPCTDNQYFNSNFINIHRAKSKLEAPLWWINERNRSSLQNTRGGHFKCSVAAPTPSQKLQTWPASCSPRTSQPTEAEHGTLRANTDHHKYKQGNAVLQHDTPNGMAHQTPSSPASLIGRKQKPTLQTLGTSETLEVQLKTSSWEGERKASEHLLFVANKLPLYSMETESCIVFLKPLLQQYYSHSQQISQPALTVTSKSRTHMPVLKSRSNLYSWVIRTLTQGLLWKALTQAAIKRDYEAVL